MTCLNQDLFPIISNDSKFLAGQQQQSRVSMMVARGGENTSLSSPQTLTRDYQGVCTP